ncbi:YceI family protein [Rariglobus hedericola]|uniref:YceI family protein n=1 Tax=Rariglobus hedericola TaxID=2597822 RepID=A0A556QDP6_9BACT|nr:YceI family protein [Rariglobus hedericola]TSJ74726.1 YceI family protein [Rariglobus hedericola]
MKPTLLLASLALATSLTAAPTSFDFKDPKGVNAVQFHLDSLLEPISGTASGVTGTVSFDPEAPAATTGKIVIEAASLKVSNSTMTGHLLSDGWIDAKGSPEITFELVKLDNAKTTGTTTTADATGKFTLKGVTKEITVPVKLTYLAGQFGKRIGKPEMGGDLLVVRGEFTINRGDYGIKPGENEDKVSNEIKLTLAIVGSAPKA